MSQSRPHDSAVNERKLKPIYDYLDNGYFKKSMQEIDKLLKKNKDWPYLRVLKALTLIRMNRQKEGTDILNEVHKEAPFDESTLQTMTICYRDLHQLEMIPSIYENAIKKDPTSEKLYTHLFMAYVRLQDYKKQQLTALNLFKVHQKNPYYFWAVMSIYMQAITASDETMATKITLPLAEKMCQKFYNDNKFESEQEVELYLMILEKQRKFTAMIDLINNSKVAGKLADTLGFVQHRKVLLLKGEGRLNEAFNDLVELIRRNCDQTEYYSELFQLATSLDEANAEKTETAFEYTLQFVALLDEMCNQSRASNWISKLEESKDAEKPSVVKGKSRGPAIAKIIHFHRIHQQAKEGASSTKLDYGKLSNSIDGMQKDDYIVDLIYEFFLQFGSKFVCVKDLIYILQETQLSQERTQSLLLKMKLSLLNLNKESSLEEVNKSLSYHYLDHYTSDLSSGLTNNYAQLSVLFPLYYTALGLVDGAKKVEEDGQGEAEDKSKEVAKSGTPSNSSQPFEPVIYLLANKICAGVDIYQDSRLLPSSATIPELLILLESALIRNVHDFYSKLLLIRLYNSLGATSASHALYESLDVKLIQNDTLGHFFLNPFLSTGVFSHAQEFLFASWKFYSYNFKEASDFIINLYKYGSFTKIEEILAFNDKLRNSIQHRFSFIERHFVNLLVDCRNHLSFSTLANDSVSQILNGSFEVDWDKICDNRDLSLLRANQSQLHSHILETLKQATHNDDILWLRYRFVLMHSLINASHLSESLFAEASTDNGDTQKAANEKLSLESLTHLVDQLAELLKALKHAASNESLKYCLEGPPPSRLHSYFKNGHSLAISTLLSYLLGIFKYCSLSDASISTMSLNLPDILAELNTFLEAIQNSQLSIFTMRQTLEELTNWTETLSICISILGVALNTVQKFVKASKKLKKKKSDGSQYKDSEQVVGTINEQLSCVSSSLEEALKRLQTTLDKGALGNLEMPTFELHFLSQLENASSIGDAIKMKLKMSYMKSYMELLIIARSKLKYLSLLSSTANQPQQQHG